jgi:hypothetical protein
VAVGNNLVMWIKRVQIHILGGLRRNIIVSVLFLLSYIVRGLTGHVEAPDACKRLFRDR